ncbi:SAM-dependent methyltransferase [Dietzia sp. UCD-THP]|uniref:class I SAM-dependent methyltransferase n=1 Tax=Dietzia sp. UCD-THP TaxID=1292020 RepID=UPI0003622D61|nr:SAM-dependent methyltransferase [Dietzia sp. UCD-THP]
MFASVYARDRQLYSASVTSTNPPDHGESVRASRAWWDAEAVDYHHEHGDFLGAHSPDGEFVWCPEGLHEGDWTLLGDVAGRDVLEIGCGSAPCSRWIAGRGARAVAVDLSAGMLRVGARAASRSTGPAARVPLLQADARRLPFAADSFDVAFSAFGAIPFVADTAGVMAEAARVLRPGGRFVFSVNHPMRWIFRDDPGPEGLVAAFPYFDRTPYTEYDEEGGLTYVEHHRTVGDRIRELVGAGFVVRDLIEPEWPEWLEQEWGQWSPLRGSVFPGTAIFVATLP